MGYDTQMVKSPFANREVTISGQVDIEEARALAEIKAMVFMAKQHPRDQAASMDRILVACQRPSLAEAAIYNYAKGGSNITGASIRLAEAIAQMWGNIHFGVDELSKNEKRTELRAFAWDLETNTKEHMTFTSEHEIMAYGKIKKLTDPREIREAGANLAARAMRKCILGIIPGDVVEAAMNQCDETTRARADTSPAGIKRVTDKFAEYGVTVKMIEKKIQRNISAITPAQIVSLGKTITSLKEGLGVASDYFDATDPDQPATGTKTESVKDKLRAKVAPAVTTPDNGSPLGKVCANPDCFEPKPLTESDVLNIGNGEPEWCIPCIAGYRSKGGK
jgi:hypothetical protein